MFCGYLSIYQWNPCKSLDFFNIFSDFTSVYCEIHEILIICILFSSPLISVYKSVGAGFRRREGGIHILCICFLKQFNSSAYFIHLHCSLIWSSRFSLSDLSFGFTFINPQYLVKSWAILRFIQYFGGFHPCILWNLRIC